ncbi:MAG: formyltransferase family protein, partial [Candidatus Binatia bacterium]
MPLKLVLLTYESHPANFIIQRLLTERPGLICGIIRSETIVAGKTAWGSVRYLVRATAPGFVLWKGTEVLLSRAIWTLLRVTRRRPAVPSLRAMAAEFHVPLIGTENVNAPEIVGTVEAWHPDLIVSVYLNQRIGAAMRNLPTAGGINVHGALLPANRGLFPYFWELANG